MNNKNQWVAFFRYSTKCNLLSLISCKLLKKFTHKLQLAYFKSFVKTQQSSEWDKYHQGRPRPYLEAKLLDVVDQNIAGLVEIMNSSPMMHTIASCQGHGFIFVSASPYISFKTDSRIAASIEDELRNNIQLNYFWEVTGRFDSSYDLTYILSILGITLGSLRYAVRRSIDKDFKLIGSMIQETLNHFKGKKIVMKCKPDETDSNGTNYH